MIILSTWLERFSNQSKLNYKLKIIKLQYNLILNNWISVKYN